MAWVKEIRLSRRPVGLPTPDDFTIVEVQRAEPTDGELVVRSLYLSVDPYMRLAMNDPAALSGPMVGSGVARVVQSRSGNFREGDLVRHRAGMRDEFVSDGSNLTLFEADPELPIPAQMNALGGIGLCAYGGLLDTGRLQPDEQVFVSSAAGAVGSLAVQIAKLRHCHVIGSAGSADKVAWLKGELGVDVAINYRDENISEALAKATPKGLDVYFDNVGGSHLDAALHRMNRNGRIAVCGMISAYNGGASVVTALHEMIYPRVTIKGFGFDEFVHLQATFRRDMLGWLKTGAIRTRETIFDGIESVPEALIGLFQGRGLGKVLVRVSD